MIVYPSTTSLAVGLATTKPVAFVSKQIGRSAIRGARWAQRRSWSGELSRLERSEYPECPAKVGWGAVAGFFCVLGLACIARVWN